jgi:hypothetical protein
MDAIDIPPASVDSISVTPSTAVLAVGERKQFTETVSPSNAANKNVTWTSGSPAVATVDAAGWVLGVSAGNTVITATAQDGSGVTGSASVTVSQSLVPVTDVSISPKTATMLAGKQKEFTAMVYPTNASNKAVTWASDSPAVAEVDAAGVVYGVSPGKAVITVTTQEGAFSARAQVSVLKSAEPPAPPTGLDTAKADPRHVPGTSLYTLVISDLEGAPVPDGTAFYIWLKLLSRNEGAAALDAAALDDEDYIGPFVAASVIVDGEAQLEFDVSTLRKWDGTDASISSGQYSIKFADAATKNTYVGELKTIKITNSSEGGKGGGGGCDAGLGFMALLAGGTVLIARARRYGR